MQMLFKSIKLSNGMGLPYVEQGDPEGIPMLLLHGYTDSWMSFAPVLPQLPASIHAFALTQRGHGDADRPASGYRTRDFARDAAEFLQAISVGPVVVIGHSMGGTNAQRLAIDHPNLVRGLALAGSFAGYRDNPAIIEFWEKGVSQLSDPIDPKFVREFQQSTLALPAPEDVVETAVRESLKVPARVWRAAFEGFLEDDCLSELHRITAPTLILWGTHDSLCRRCDEETLLAAIPRSRLVEYPNAGHALHWELPERLAADVSTFALSLGA